LYQSSNDTIILIGDGWIGGMSYDGTIKWNQTMGEKEEVYLWLILPTTDKSLLLVGETRSKIWLVKIQLNENYQERTLSEVTTRQKITPSFTIISLLPLLLLSYLPRNRLKKKNDQEKE
jgi:hypothetical protein